MSESEIRTAVRCWLTKEPGRLRRGIWAMTGERSGLFFHGDRDEMQIPTWGIGELTYIQAVEIPPAQALTELATYPEGQAELRRLFAQWPAEPEAVGGIYVASRASIPARSEMWRRLRDAGHKITSTWIDEAGEGETADFRELWTRIIEEIRAADKLVLYAEQNDFPLKGALVEVGIALGMGKPVVVCLPGVDLEGRTYRPVGSWIAHQHVVRRDRIHEAMDFSAAPAIPQRAAPKSAAAVQAEESDSCVEAANLKPLPRYQVWVYANDWDKWGFHWASDSMDEIDELIKEMRKYPTDFPGIVVTESLRQLIHPFRRKSAGDEPEYITLESNP